MMQYGRAAQQVWEQTPLVPGCAWLGAVGGCMEQGGWRV